jgi:PAS domain S-box-containing protein
MSIKKDIFSIFEHDDNYRYIMRRLLEVSMEQSFNGIMITEAGPHYPIIYVNDAFCQMTGYGPQEIIGKSPSILQGAKTDSQVIDRLQHQISKGELFHGRAINYRKDGTEFMMEWKIAPIHNDDNEISHYLAIQRDVSGQAV